MRVLVIGSGAREHALVARLTADRDAGDLLAAPGNPGIARLARTWPLDPGDVDAIAALADREQIDLTVIGPELPLSLGVANRFRSGGATPLRARPPTLRASNRVRRLQRRSWRVTVCRRRGFTRASRSTRQWRSFAAASLASRSS